MAEDLGLGGALGATSEIGAIVLYSILGNLIGSVMAPLTTEIQQLMYSRFPDQPISPADVADMVVRNIVSQAEGAKEAALSGLDQERFNRLVGNTGEPPGLEFLLQAWRRGYIPQHGAGPAQASLEQGIRESRLKDKWISIVERMGIVPLPPSDAVDAVVEGQISFEAGQTAAYASGVSADDFRVLVNTRGRPPDPTQLNVLHKRGLIPLEGTGPDALSVQQGIFEGATKDKWWQLLAQLGDYVPPPRTVTAMVREGSLSDDQALTLFQHAGLSQELAAQFLTSAHHQKTAKTRELTVSAIVQLYEDRIIDRTEAAGLLHTMTYSPADAEFELELADFRVVQKALNSAITRIRSLFVAHKIDAVQVTTTLDSLHVGPDQRAQLLETWQLERAANVQLPTVATVLGAVKLGFLSPDDAATRLVERGFTLADARLEIAVHLKVDPWAAAPAPAA